MIMEDNSMFKYGENTFLEVLIFEGWRSKTTLSSLPHTCFQIQTFMLSCPDWFFCARIPFIICFYYLLYGSAS